MKKENKSEFRRRAIPVAKIQPETDEVIEIYNSLTEAAESMKSAQIGNISRACRGIINTHKGFKWKYLQEIPVKNIRS